MGQDIKIGFRPSTREPRRSTPSRPFREAFWQRRCQVPLDSFYESKKPPTGLLAQTICNSRLGSAMVLRERY